MRSALQRTLLVAVAAVTALAIASAASADRVDVESGAVTVAQGGSATGKWRIHADGGDCAAADGTPATVTISVGGGITPSSGSLVFTSCNDWQEVTFSVPASTAPGDYPVGVGVTDADSTDIYTAGGAGLTITVTGTTTPPPADTTAPTVTVPADTTLQATSPAGATFSFTASATDNVDGSVAVTCSPASGATFPIGSTTVTCTARDAAGNPGSASFTVTVTAPAPTNAAPTVTVPSTQVAEAAGPTGANVNFIPLPAAQDAEDGPLAVTCSATSGSLFPLGTTTVTCSATDSAAQQTTATFDVVVRDTTPPVVTAPADLTIISATPVPRDHQRIAIFRSLASAADLVSTPVVTDDAPAVFPLGRTVVTFRAVDAAGNSESARAVVTVVAPPAPGQPAPPTPPPAVREPPGNVLDLRARPLDRGVRLEWRPGPRATRYVVTRSLRGGTATRVFDGRATRYVDRGLTNGVEYRYVVISYDAAGLRSVGVAIVAVPARPMLLRPAHNASLRKPPTLAWRSVPGAAYYNVQLFRVSTRSLAQAAQRKILSAWPLTTKLRVKTTWKFGGRAQRLAPGVYEWYVWPGYGNRKAKRYGQLMGWSRFTIRAPVRRP